MNLIKNLPGKGSHTPAALVSWFKFLFCKRIRLLAFIDLSDRDIRFIEFDLLLE